MPLPFDLETSIALVCAITIALLVCLVAFALGGGVVCSRRMRRRLNLVRDRAEGILPANAVTLRPLSRQQSATPRIDRLAGWLPRRDLLTVRLARTGRTISVGQYAMATVGLTVAAAFLLALAFPIGIIPSLLIGLLVGIALPHMLIGRMGRRRVAAFIALFPEAIDLMVRALRSGLPISEAIVGAGREIGDPVGSELRRVEAGMRLGRDLESLLWDIAQRVDVPEFRFFIIALGVQRETGGNLAETLANLADILRRRRQMQAKVRAMSSETRATTMILGGLPVIMILLLLLTSPGYLVPLYNDVRGLILDGLALAMLGSGVLIMSKMARFEI